MEKLQFTILISASREKVWEILWGEIEYPEWTSVFSPESRVVTDWKKGSRAQFLDGAGDGLISIIDEHIHASLMSFRHVGVLKNGVEDLLEPEKKGWSGAMETYSLHELDGSTELIVQIDTVPVDKNFFQKAWPEAMQKIKEMSEAEA